MSGGQNIIQLLLWWSPRREESTHVFQKKNPRHLFYRRHVTYVCATSVMVMWHFESIFRGAAPDAAAVKLLFSLMSCRWTHRCISPHCMCFIHWALNVKANWKETLQYHIGTSLFGTCDVSMQLPAFGVGATSINPLLNTFSTLALYWMTFSYFFLECAV